MAARKLEFAIKATAFGGGAMLLLFFCIETADGKQARRKKRVHSHSHGHSHGHSQEHSSWILGAGVSVTKGLGGGESSSGESGGDHSGHSHLTGSAPSDDSYSLGEGHSHDGGESGAEGSSSAVEPLFSAIVGYRISSNVAASLNLALGTSSGIGDPVLSGEFRMPKLGKIGSTFIPSISAPLSEASKDSYKTTTVSASWNPSLRLGKALYSGTIGLAKSYYSKTVIVEEEAAGRRMNLSATSPAFAMMQDDDGHDHDHDDGEIHEDGEDLGTGDREFDRYSASFSGNYRLAKMLLASGGFGLALVTKQFGPSQIESTLTVAKATYLLGSLATSASFGLSSSDESFKTPSSPFVSLSVFYSYE